MLSSPNHEHKVANVLHLILLLLVIIAILCSFPVHKILTPRIIWTTKWLKSISSHRDITLAKGTVKSSNKNKSIKGVFRKHTPAMSKVQYEGMVRWAGRNALVTGCSSGIGAVIAKDLLRYGVNVIGCARNIDKIKDLSEECSKAGFTGKLISYKCNVGNSSEIEEMFAWIEKNHGGVDICVNNAGAGTLTPLLEIKGEEMTTSLNTNVMGLVLCSNLAVKSMFARNVNDGHIINISSMLGHLVPGIMNFYTATKHAVTALTKGLRMEIAAKGSRIKVSQISPGRVETGFHLKLFGDEDKGRRFYESVESLNPQDVSDAVMHALSAGDNCQVYDVMLQPTNLGSGAAYQTQK